MMTNLYIVFQLIQESNDSITQMKSIESLVSLSAKVDFECRVSVAFMFPFCVIHFLKVCVQGHYVMLDGNNETVPKRSGCFQRLNHSMKIIGYTAVIGGKHLYSWLVILQ